MKEIKLTQGKVALVDDEDFEYLNQWKWCALKKRNTYYTMRNVHQRISKCVYKSTAIYMHRLILNITDRHVYCDHINHDGLDNRKCNLRTCSNRENLLNCKPLKDRKYKGINFRTHNPKKPYASQVHLNGKKIHLGYFKTPKEAALAYDKAAKKLHGEFAYLNFPTK